MRPKCSDCEVDQGVADNIRLKCIPCVNKDSSVGDRCKKAGHHCFHFVCLETTKEKKVARVSICCWCGKVKEEDLNNRDHGDFI